MSLAASSSWLSIWLAVFFTGCAIKLMDDYVDRELDQVLGGPNLAHVMGDGLPIYMALATALGIYLAPTIGITLFLAAYLVGMGDEIGARYLAGWRAWVEILVAAVLGYVIAPSHFTLNLILISIVQLGDDILDLSRDRLTGKRTLPKLLGRRLSTLMLLALALAALAISPWYSISVMTSAWLITAVAERVCVAS